jgi:hypothetical protein
MPPSPSARPPREAHKEQTSAKKASAVLAPVVNVGPAVSSAASGLAAGLGALGDAGLKGLSETLGPPRTSTPNARQSALSPSQSYDAVKSEVENNMDVYADNETIAYLLYLDPSHPVDLSSKDKIKRYFKSYAKAETLAANVLKRYGPESYFIPREKGPLVPAFYGRHQIPSPGNDIKPFVAGAPLPGYNLQFLSDGGAARIKEEVIVSARGPAELASISDRIFKKIGPLLNVHSFELEVVPGLNPLLKIKTTTGETADEVTELFQRDRRYHPNEYGIPPKFVSAMGDGFIGRIAAPRIWAQKPIPNSLPMDALHFRAFLIYVAAQMTRESDKPFSENLKWAFENGQVDLMNPHLNREVLPDEKIFPTALASARLLEKDSEVPEGPRQHVRDLLKEFKPFLEHLHQGNLSPEEMAMEEDSAWLSFVLKKEGGIEPTRL